MINQRAAAPGLVKSFGCVICSMVGNPTKEAIILEFYLGDGYVI
jgi:hypothetical protein